MDASPDNPEGSIGFGGPCRPTRGGLLPGVVGRCPKLRYGATALRGALDLYHLRLWDGLGLERPKKVLGDDVLMENEYRTLNSAQQEPQQIQLNWVFPRRSRRPSE